MYDVCAIKDVLLIWVQNPKGKVQFKNSTPLNWPQSDLHKAASI